MRIIKQIDLFFLLYLVIVLFYCIFLSQFGYELWDTGYITSFSWKIINGEFPYQDFIYKGPPVTLYLHAFFMKIIPENSQFYFIRIVNYLFFAIQIIFSVTAFDKFYDLKKFAINKWALMSVCFIISLLNFPPYPWPTTDGLFFASTALYLLSLKSQKYYMFFLISLFSILSALTKQSFYPIPLLFLAWIFINYGIKKAVLFFLFLIIQISVFIYCISSITSIEKFIKLTTGETTFAQLFYTGFLNYFWLYENKWILYLVLFSSSIVLFLYQLKQKLVTIKSPFKIISIVLVIFSILLCFNHDFLNASRVAFLSCAFGLLYSFNFNLKTIQYYSTLLLFLGFAWCSSISLGYPFPILFTTGIILSLLVLLKNEFLTAKKNFLYYPIILIITTIAFSYTFYPYREMALTKLNYKLDEISPKLIGIKTTKANLYKLKELKQLKNKYGNRFIVAPNIPMAHYLFNSKSLMPADWLINSEINKNPKLFINIASQQNNYVFLEKSFLLGEILMPAERQKFSIIAEYIYKNFNQIDETKNFIIYNGVKKNEALPKIN